MSGVSKNAPCPFCGGLVDPTGWLRGDGVHGPECESCGATAPNIDLWNQARRAGHVGASAEMVAVQHQGSPDAIVEGLMTSCGISQVLYACTVPLKDGEQVRLYREQPAPVPVVPELTNELRYIFGLMCFQCITYAQALRQMGHTIAERAEDEQAATIHWLLGHYLRDPDNWRANAVVDIKAAKLAAEQQ